MVSQKSAILDSTILDNIIFGRTERSLPRKLIEEVLEYSLLSDFIRNLPKGIDTEIGQTGVKISGGEAQRISIARALISKPKLIVLDEATSALDGYTEFQVIEKLKSLSWRPTLIMVAHRLSSIRNFDQIVLIDKGQISGSGAFNDIRKRFDIFDIQAKSMGL